MSMTKAELELLATIYCCLKNGMDVTEEEIEDLEKYILKCKNARDKKNKRAKDYVNKNRDIYNLYTLRAKAKEQGNNTKVDELDEQIKATRLGI